MNKERLEEAKLMAKMLRVETRLPHDFPFDLVDWLVEQAELVGYFARKNGELNEFLNKYVEPKHLGKNVIDVAMDIIVKQSERVQELEELVEGYKIELMIKDNAKKRANQQNKRYREALTFYAEKSNYDYNVKVDSIGYIGDWSDMKFYRLDSAILNDRGEKARQALEGEE